MRGGAHRLMGIALGGIIISVVKPVLPAAVVVVITSVWGEMTPDIDTVNSTISRRIPIIPRLINRKFGHRGLLHSPIFLVGLWLVVGEIFGVMYSVLDIWDTWFKIYLPVRGFHYYSRLIKGK